MKEKLLNEIEDVFQKELPAIMGDAFEPRSGQSGMASLVGEAALRNKIAVIEAETGLGKSLAYLVPAIIFCARYRKRAVVSTYTRSLQRQLMEKDLPLASRAAGCELKVSVLMGRSNYACKMALGKMLEKGHIRGGRTVEILSSIMQDTTGDLENMPEIDLLDRNIRDSISCPERETLCRGCKFRDECFLYVARKTALGSDIVFVNHSLLFSDAKAGGALLGPFDLLVIDEAHHLLEAATTFLTLSFSLDAVKGKSHSLHTEVHDQYFSYARALAVEENQGRAKEIESLWKEFNKKLDAADRSARRFFELLGENCMKISSFDDGSIYGRNLEYTEGSPLFYGTEDERNTLAKSLSGAAELVQEMSDLVAVKDEKENGVESMLFSYVDSLKELYELFDLLVSGNDEDYVFFVKIDSSGRAYALSASPVDVSAQLAAYLQECAGSVILTSATLSVDGDFSYVLDGTGLSSLSNVITRRFESPFDLATQRKVLLAAFLPEPNEEGFIPRAAEVISGLSKGISRKILVLCTSRAQLGRLHEHLSSDPDLETILLSQQEGVSRSRLTRAFKRGGNKILLGLASFWEGIDLPGQLLEIVVIMKMPFMVPTEPIVRARARRLSDRGEEPFKAMFLPEAVLKLKQGCGRLIRTGSDRGVVVVLDSRLGGKSYGPIVIRSLAGSSMSCDDLDELLSEAKKVFM